MEVTNTQDASIIDNIISSQTDSSSLNQTESASAQSAFSSFMKTALGKTVTANVNEEELFAGLIEERLNNTNPEAADYYREEKQRLLGDYTRKDGYVFVEDLAVAALKGTVEAGKIDEETATKINGQAFRAAQLDDNLNALYDGRGSVEDPTIAVASMDAAMRLIEEAIKKIESGEMDTELRSLDSVADTSAGISPTGDGSTQSLDGEGGFLWKPESESDGNLVILLPTSLNDLISSVGIYSALPPDDANKLGEGRFAGDDKNGNRGHYRFDKSGGEYGDNVYVVATKNDGSYSSWAIEDGSSRND